MPTVLVYQQTRNPAACVASERDLRVCLVDEEVRLGFKGSDESAAEDVAEPNELHDNRVRPGRLAWCRGLGSDFGHSQDVQREECTTQLNPRQQADGTATQRCSEPFQWGIPNVTSGTHIWRSLDSANGSSTRSSEIVFCGSR